MQSLPFPAASLPDAPALRTMFEARKRVFVDILKWNVPVLGGIYEVDQFDNHKAEYLVLLDESGLHRASARLLRTEEPHILADLYPLLCDGAVPAGPSTREITRFCLEPRQRTAERRQARDQLVTALADHALNSGITEYTGVASVGWFAQIAAFGWQCTALGSPRTIAGHRLVGLHIRIDETTRARLKAAGIYSPLTFRLARSPGVQS